jgi:RNA polymerase sigma factor (sigma-70 family)
MNDPSIHQLDTSQPHLDAFKQLFQHHKKSVYALALSILRDASLAEDVLQEVFIKFFQRMNQQDITNQKAWLMRVTRNMSLDLYYRKKREVTGFDEAYFERPYDMANDSVEKIVLMKYLESLYSDERQIILLKDIAGMKHREIAKIMEMPLGTVLWKYNRALKKLKNEVSEEDF